MKVVAGIAAGLPQKEAARAASIDPSTLWRWRQDDATLDIALQRARALFLTRQVQRVDEAAAKGDWKAAAFLLERTAPEAFGKRLVIAAEEHAVPMIDPLSGRLLDASAEAQSNDEQPEVGQGGEATTDGNHTDGDEPPF